MLSSDSFKCFNVLTLKFHFLFLLYMLKPFAILHYCFCIFVSGMQIVLTKRRALGFLKMKIEVRLKEIVTVKAPK